VQTDAELVKAALGGDRASFGTLVQRYQRAVLGVALGVLGDYHAAEDAAQDALVAAHGRLRTLRKPERFAAWLLRIVRRRAIDAGRRESKRREQSVPPDGMPQRADGASSGPAGEVFEAVDRLPGRQRQMILHRYCDGLSVSEIATATGSPVGTVTKYLSRAHARLRKLLLKDASE